MKRPNLLSNNYPKYLDEDRISLKHRHYCLKVLFPHRPLIAIITLHLHGLPHKINFLPLSNLEGVCEGHLLIPIYFGFYHLTDPQLY